jgi:ABC-2 type transport system ATP-binding protein
VSEAPAIRTRALRKVFGTQAAVDGIDLVVPRGAVFGFLGPNGSGKTTTIRLILGLAAPTSGDVQLLGRLMPAASAAVLPHVGALVEGPAFAPYLSGRANLARLDTANPLAQAASRRTRITEALQRVGLSHVGGKKVKAYSLGMKQRLGIAATLLMPRELLILDEPTNGLDPQGTREVRSLIRGLADDGTTVLVSSHLLSEIEQVCTHAAIMSVGRIVAQGTIDELRGLTGDARVRLRTPDAAAARRVLDRLGIAVIAAADIQVADEIVGRLRPGLPPEEVVGALVAAGVRVRGFEVGAESLEERFVELTGEGFDVAG